MPTNKRDYQRAYMRRYRAKKKAKREKFREKALERHLKENPLDFITGMPKIKPEPYPLSWREFKELHPEKTFEEFIRAKEEWRKDQISKPLELPVKLSKEERDFVEGVKASRYRKHDLIGFKDKK